MNSRLLMSMSAAFLGLCGVAGLFLPQETAAFFNPGSDQFNVLVIQILSALYLGFAMLNWMARGNLIGGIYSRPVAVGNFTHFAIGAITLIKLVFRTETHFIFILIFAVIYALFAVSFGIVFVNNPAKLKITPHKK